MRKTHKVKKTKKLKKTNGGGLFGFLRRDKKVKTEPTIKKKINTVSTIKKKEGILDRIFTKICKKKIERYKSDPVKESSGVLYKACKFIFKNKFDEIDSTVNSKRILQPSITKNSKMGEQLLRLLHTKLSKYMPTFKDDFFRIVFSKEGIFLGNEAINPIDDIGKRLINNGGENNINFRINLYSKFIKDILNGVNMNSYRYIYPSDKIYINDYIPITPMVRPFLESLYKETVKNSVISEPISARNVNLWLSASHGNISPEYSKKSILPKNIVLIYITPINRYGIIQTEYNNRLNELMKLYQQWIKAYRSANLCDILKMIQSFNCFLESAIFLPGQEYLDVDLIFTEDSSIISDLPFGIFKYEDERQTIDPGYLSCVSDVINKKMRDKEETHIYFVNCCRMCDSDISNTFTERIYIYEAFYGLLNSFVIDNLSTINDFNISKENDCIYQSGIKKYGKNTPATYAIMNKSLTPTQIIMNEIKKIIYTQIKSDEEKSQKISRLLELFREIKLTEKQWVVLFRESYLLSFTNIKTKEPYIDDLTYFEFDNTFLKLLFKLMIEQKMSKDFIIERLEIILLIIKNDNNGNNTLYKKILECLIMIDEEITLNDKDISDLFKLINTNLIDSNSLIESIYKYFEEKHPNILSNVMITLSNDIINRTLKSLLPSTEKLKEISALALLKYIDIQTLFTNVIVSYIYNNITGINYIDDLNLDGFFLKSLFKIMLQIPEIGRKPPLDYLFMVLKRIYEEKDNIKMLKNILQCLMMIDDAKKINDNDLINNYDFFSLFFHHFNNELTQDENDLLNLIVTYIKDKHPSLLVPILKRIFNILTMNMDNNNKKTYKEYKQQLKDIIDPDKLIL